MTIMTLYRSHRTQYDDVTPPLPTGAGFLPSLARKLDGILPQRPVLRERNVWCLKMIMPDGSEDSVDYNQADEEAKIQTCVNKAAEHGFYASKKAIGLFSIRRIDKLYFEK